MKKVYLSFLYYMFFIKNSIVFAKPTYHMGSRGRKRKKVIEKLQVRIILLLCMTAIVKY